MNRTMIKEMLIHLDYAISEYIEAIHACHLQGHEEMRVYYINMKGRAEKLKDKLKGEINET